MACAGRKKTCGRHQKLLKGAGHESHSFTLTNRAVPQPYEPVGVWLIDQWRQIGVNVKQVMLESAAWFHAQKTGEHEASTNAPCNSIVEPDMDLHWFLSASPANYSRHKDTVMDELYAKQSRSTDPDERRRLLRAFEKRLYDEEVHFQGSRLDEQLDTVWLSE